MTKETGDVRLSPVVMAPLIPHAGHDYSQGAFGHTNIQNENLFEANFNGCELDGIVASHTVFQHAEFTEARIARSAFEGSSFDHADFVLSTIEKTLFARCSFQNGEWRDTIFRDVEFRQCVFRNTTSSLVRFERCTFDDASTASFIGHSKRYSTFVESRFPLTARDLEYLRSNFGLEASSDADAGAAVSFQPHDELHRLALLEYAGALTTSAIATSMTALVAVLMNSRRTGTRLPLRFLAQIVRQLAQYKRLSVFALQYMEKSLAPFVDAVTLREEAVDLMALLVTLRMAKSRQIADIDNEMEALGLPHSVPVGITLHFERTFTDNAVADFMESMRLFCDAPVNALRLLRVTNGSTIAEIAAMSAIPLIEILRFLKQSLSLATVTITQGTKLKGAVKKLIAAPERHVRKAAHQGTGKRGQAARRRKTAPAGQKRVDVSLVGPPQLEVFVDAVGERVLIMDGRVKVTITLA